MLSCEPFVCENLATSKSGYCLKMTDNWMLSLSFVSPLESFLQHHFHVTYQIFFFAKLLIEILKHYY